MPKLYDMHCHLDFADNAKDVAEQANGLISCIDSTVVPSSYVSAKEKFASFPDVHVALGIHPWWIADNRIGEVDVARFETCISSTNLVGEIGLDFGKRCKSSKVHQLEVFERILQAISDSGNNKLVFLHAVKCYDELFKMMEEAGTFKNNTCVFHWFQGTPDDFGRALASGCMFSVGMRMLASGSGSFFAKEVPIESLMIESDNPPHDGMPWSSDIWSQELENTIRGLAELREDSEVDIANAINSNSERLLQTYDPKNTTN